MHYPLTSYVFFNHGRLNPLLIRQKLIDAAESGAVTFPSGTSDQPIIHWVINNPWMCHEPCADSPDSAVLQERYGIAEKPPATPLTGFPLRAVLELLEMLGQGQPPRFVAAAWEVLEEIVTDEPVDGGEPLIIFPKR